MRRGVGLGAIDRAHATKLQYQKVGDVIAKTHIEELQTQLAVFQEQLSQFAKRHADDINSNPAFRSAFVKMCTTLGVDILSASSGKKGSLWSEILGVGDFYIEIAVRIIELCRQTRGENGGLTDLETAKTRINAQRGTGKFGEVVSSYDTILYKGRSRLTVKRDDILRAVQALKPFGPGLDVMQVGERTLIRSVPKELSSDQATVLEVAQRLGYVSPSMLASDPGWDSIRIMTVLEDLLTDGLTWIDDQMSEDELFYYIPPTTADSLAK